MFAESRLSIEVPTLGQVLREYLEARQLSERTIRQYNCLMNVGLKDWFNLPITAITKRMVQERHLALSARGKISANCTMRVLKSVINYASDIYEDEDEVPLITHNPVKRLTARKLWNKENVRYGRITSTQIPSFFRAVRELSASGELNQTHADYLVFLLLTGMRKTEAAGLTWSDVNWNNKSITLTLTKNGDPHCIPLSDYLLDMLQRRAEGSDCDWVFPHRYDCGPLTAPRYSMDKICERAGIKFKCHDLRRTFVDMLEDCGYTYDTYKKLLNHRMDVTGTSYSNRHKIDPEPLRPAMQAVTDYVLKLAGER